MVVGFNRHSFTVNFTTKVLNNSAVVNQVISKAVNFFIVRIVFFKLGFVYHSHRTGILAEPSQNFAGIAVDYNLGIIRKIQI